MKQFLKKLGIIILFFVFSLELFAQNEKLATLVKEDLLEELKTNSFIINIQDEGTDDFLLIPESEFKSKIMANKSVKSDKKFTYVYENLYYISKADILEKSKSEKTSITMDDVSKVFRSVSKMEGMKYYSNSKKKEAVLYEKAYTIANKDSSEPIPDMTEGSADGKTLYCFLEDSSLGECKYELNYFQTEDSLYLGFSNLNSVGIGPFKAIEPGNLKINILVIDCGDSMLFYLHSDSSSVKFPGIKDHISKSICARMDAMISWFQYQF